MGGVAPAAQRRRQRYGPDEYQAIKVIEQLFCAGLGSEKRRKADAAGLVRNARLEPKQDVPFWVDCCGTITTLSEIANGPVQSDHNLPRFSPLLAFAQSWGFPCRSPTNTPTMRAARLGCDPEGAFGRSWDS